MELTTLIAVYGAALSSFVFGWNMYRDLTDRGKLRVESSVAQLVEVPSLVPGEPEWKVHLRITNIGRRAVWITGVGGRFTSEMAFELISRNRLPMKLEPGQLIDEAPDAGEFEDPRDIAYFSVRDSTGREYRSSIRSTWRTISGLLSGRGEDGDLGLGFKLHHLVRRARVVIEGWVEL